MGNLYTRVSEIMDKIYNNNSPGNATALEEELAKKLKESFGESYKKALSEIEIIDDSMEAIPSPGQVVVTSNNFQKLNKQKPWPLLMIGLII